MLPEESVQAAVDLGAKQALPIHWGKFNLAFHSWTEPAERFIQKAHDCQVPVCTPQIGQELRLSPSETSATTLWWR